MKKYSRRKATVAIHAGGLEYPGFRRGLVPIF